MREPLPSEAAWEEGLGCPARSSCLLHNQVNWSQTLKTKACDPSKGCCPFLRFSIVLPTMSAFVLSRFSCLTLCDPVDCSSPGSCVHGFSRQEHLSALPFPSPVHESEKKVKIPYRCTKYNICFSDFFTLSERLQVQPRPWN